MLLRKFWHNERAGIVVISLKLLAQSIRSHLTMPVLFSGDSSGVIISQYIHTNNRVIYSTRHKHFVLCVGTALRCKGGGGNSNEEYQQEYSPLYHNVDERDEKLKAEMTLP
ncbi:hypothetical protein, partial [Escherichia coli]|uniref:hypothetical protein n=1 Tax=Escherichia coli TaxID=562 RepID=UPI001BDB9613